MQKTALEKGFYFPVDFASSGSSQIGGNIATNAGGIKVIRYGLMRDWVLGLKVVLSNGTLLDMTNRCIKNNTGYDLKQIFVGSHQNPYIHLHLFYSTYALELALLYNAQQ